MTWLLRNLILALSGNDSPYQLAFGALVGWCWGFCPFTSPIGLALLLFIIFFRVNISLTLAAFLCAKTLSWPLMGLIIQTGHTALTMEALNSVWTSIFNTPYLAISGFNEPRIMGSLVIGLAFGIIGFPFLIKFTPYYREKILPKFEKFWIIRVLKGSKLYTTFS